MLDKNDAQWWIAEVEQRPFSAPALIRMLADRLAFLDKQNEDLRAEVIRLRRQAISGTPSDDINSLRQRVQALERMVSGEHGQRLLAYGRDRIEINASLASLLDEERVIGLDTHFLITSSGAALYGITAESRAYAFRLDDLPIPEAGSGAIPLGQPNTLVTILDRARVEERRFLLLRTANGYLYHLLTGVVATHAAKGEKLLRGLLPGDSVVEAIPAGNGDAFALSRQGRWSRFPERTIPGAGALAMTLPKGDSLVGVLSLMRTGNIVVLTEDGRIVALSPEAYPARKAPGASAGQLRSAVPVLGLGQGATLRILTRRGRVIEVDLKGYQGADGSPTAIRELPPNETILAWAFN
ncbi:MAG TPA: hypothetical protein PLD47_05490 [Aggregatilineales bacterium]|nr:hypothetical protein [Anaerolineales bacterium]HRE47159.1 hypothetical protein [Aggregatilineales bacterium]